MCCYVSLSLKLCMETDSSSLYQVKCFGMCAAISFVDTDWLLDFPFGVETASESLSGGK